LTGDAVRTQPAGPFGAPAVDWDNDVPDLLASALDHIERRFTAGTRFCGPLTRGTAGRSRASTAIRADRDLWSTPRGRGNPTFTSTDDVHDNGITVAITLGTATIVLPPPLDKLVRELAASRRGHAAIGRPAVTPWLFAGGRPITDDALGTRLKKIGPKPGSSDAPGGARPRACDGSAAWFGRITRDANGGTPPMPSVARSTIGTQRSGPRRRLTAPPHRRGHCPGHVPRALPRTRSEAGAVHPGGRGGAAGSGEAERPLEISRTLVVNAVDPEVGDGLSAAAAPAEVRAGQDRDRTEDRARAHASA
jgi:hypothetical protein